MSLRVKLKKFIKILFSLLLVFILSLLTLQVYFYEYTKEQYYIDCKNIPSSEYVMILGCGVINNRPTPLLKNRLDAGIKIVTNKKADKIILSGYKDGDYYDEVQVMKNYLIEHGINKDRIIEDKNGNNTYYSIKNIEKYGDKSTIIITQKWHLIRALYLANKMDEKNIYGFQAADSYSTSYNMYMNFRESFARGKAVLDVYGIHLE